MSRREVITDPIFSMKVCRTILSVPIFHMQVTKGTHCLWWGSNFTHNVVSKRGLMLKDFEHVLPQKSVLVCSAVASISVSTYCMCKQKLMVRNR